MTKSRPNDNGRYFEFLLTDFLVNEFKISLTERAKIDQERDKEKVVKPKALKGMNDAVIKIKNWLEMFSVDSVAMGLTETNSKLILRQNYEHLTARSEMPPCSPGK